MTNTFMPDDDPIWILLDEELDQQSDPLDGELVMSAAMTLSFGLDLLVYKSGD